MAPLKYYQQSSTSRHLLISSFQKNTHHTKQLFQFLSLSPLLVSWSKNTTTAVSFTFYSYYMKQLFFQLYHSILNRFKTKEVTPREYDISGHIFSFLYECFYLTYTCYYETFTFSSISYFCSEKFIYYSRVPVKRFQFLSLKLKPPMASKPRPSQYENMLQLYLLRDFYYSRKTSAKSIWWVQTTSNISLHREVNLCHVHFLIEFDNKFKKS